MVFKLKCLISDEMSFSRPKVSTSRKYSADYAIHQFLVVRWKVALSVVFLGYEYI